MSYYGGWAPYVPVAERRAKAQKQMAKMKKKGLNVQPVELSGRKIAGSFWGKGWCDHMESFGDYANRLPRGRTYVRNGSVCHLEIKPGRIEAIVSGSSLYNVAITIFPLAIHKWKAVKASCSGRIGSLIDLLRGKLDKGVMEVVADRRAGLFPLPGEIKFTCDCPDSAGMCKHISAVLYGVGARLDHSPELLFLLREVNHEELVDVSAALSGATKTGTSRRRIAASGLADVFGVEMVEAAQTVPDRTEIISGKKSKIPSKIPAKQTVALQLPKNKSVVAKDNKMTKEVLPFPNPITGADIAAWRSSLGETLADFARRTTVLAQTVTTWERSGASIIKLQMRTLYKLKKAWVESHKLP